MAQKPKPPGRQKLHDRRLKLAARLLFESEDGRTDKAIGAAHHVSSRTIRRWRDREAAGELPEVTAELKRLRSEAADVVKLRAEQVLEQIYGFLERATQSDPKDPRMVEAMVKAFEVVHDAVAMAAMSNVPRTRQNAPHRAEAGAVARVAGGASSAEQPTDRPIH